MSAWVATQRSASSGGDITAVPVARCSATTAVAIAVPFPCMASRYALLPYVTVAVPLLCALTHTHSHSSITFHRAQERVRVCQLCINSFANVGSPAQTGQDNMRKLLLRHAPDSPVVAAMSPSTRPAKRSATPAAHSRPATPGTATSASQRGAGDDASRNVFEDPSVKTQLAYGRQLFASPLTGARRASITRLDPHMSPLWVPDQLVSECAHCASAFSLFNRKHHCRQCGNVFWCVHGADAAAVCVSCCWGCWRLLRP